MSKNLAGATAAKDRLHAATQDGLWTFEVASDGSLKQLGHNFKGKVVDSVTISRNKSNLILAGIPFDGVWRSDDGGHTWCKVMAGDIRSVAFDPTNDDVIYVGTEPVHLYRSEDGGKTFSELESLQTLPEDTRKRLGQAEATAVDFANPKFRHGRQEWSFPLAPHDGHIIQIYVRPDDPTEIMLAIEHGGIAMSFDRGKTWEDVSEGIDYLDIHKVMRLPGMDNRYLASTARGFYVSEDPRKGWVRAQEGIGHDYFHELTTLPPEHGQPRSLVLCSAHGSPGKWPAAVSQRNVWTQGLKGSHAALYRSDNDGASWKRLGIGKGLSEEMDAMIWSVGVHPRSHSVVFAAVGEVDRGSASAVGGKGAILASTDRGENWREVSHDMPAVRQIAV